MNGDFSGYFMLTIGTALIIYVGFVSFKTLREKKQANKKTRALLQKEAQKYFYDVCKPFLHTLSYEHPLPNNYVTVIIEGDVMSVYSTRYIRARKGIERLKCKKIETKLFEARYHLNPRRIKTYVCRRDLMIAEANYILADFETMIRGFLSHEYAIDPRAQVKK